MRREVQEEEEKRSAEVRVSRRDLKFPNYVDDLQNFELFDDIDAMSP